MRGVLHRISETIERIGCVFRNVGFRPSNGIGRSMTSGFVNSVVHTSSNTVISNTFVDQIHGRIPDISSRSIATRIATRVGGCGKNTATRNKPPIITRSLSVKTNPISPTKKKGSEPKPVVRQTTFVERPKIITTVPQRTDRSRSVHENDTLSGVDPSDPVAKVVPYLHAPPTVTVDRLVNRLLHSTHTDNQVANLFKAMAQTEKHSNRLLMLLKYAEKKKAGEAVGASNVESSSTGTSSTITSPGYTYSHLDRRIATVASLGRIWNSSESTKGLTHVEGVGNIKKVTDKGTEIDENVTIIDVNGKKFNKNDEAIVESDRSPSTQDPLIREKQDLVLQNVIGEIFQIDEALVYSVISSDSIFDVPPHEVEKVNRMQGGTAKKPTAEAFKIEETKHNEAAMQYLQTTWNAVRERLPQLEMTPATRIPEEETTVNQLRLDDANGGSYLTSLETLADFDLLRPQLAKRVKQMRAAEQRALESAGNKVVSKPNKRLPMALNTTNATTVGKTSKFAPPPPPGGSYSDQNGTVASAVPAGEASSMASRMLNSTSPRLGKTVSNTAKNSTVTSGSKEAVNNAQNAKADGAAKEKTTKYAPVPPQFDVHWTEKQLQWALDELKVEKIEGIIRILAFSTENCMIVPENSPKNLETSSIVPGFISRNRAMQGDRVVAIRYKSKEEWKSIVEAVSTKDPTKYVAAVETTKTSAVEAVTATAETTTNAESASQAEDESTTSAQEDADATQTDKREAWRIVSILERAVGNKKIVGSCVHMDPETGMLKFQPRDSRLPAYRIPIDSPGILNHFGVDKDSLANRMQQETLLNKKNSCEHIPSYLGDGGGRIKKEGSKKSKSGAANQQVNASAEELVLNNASSLVGHLCVIEFDQWKRDEFLPRGKFLLDLGSKGFSKSESDAIVAWYGFDPVPHGAEILEEVSQDADIKDEYDIIENFRTDVKNAPPAPSAMRRLDLREHLDVFTIDPPTAKDLDDAISIRTYTDYDEHLNHWQSIYRENGFTNAPEAGIEGQERVSMSNKENVSADKPRSFTEIGVHIADVSHYVRPGSLTDKEAVRRTTTVYLPQNVYHMLPPRLSELSCSLNPDGDKKCFSVFYTLDNETGELLPERTRFARTLIRPKCRMDYDSVDTALSGAGSATSSSTTSGTPPSDVPPKTMTITTPEGERKIIPVPKFPVPDRMLEKLRSIADLTQKRKDQRLGGGGFQLANQHAKNMISGFRFDEHGWPTDIMYENTGDLEKRKASLSHTLIEELMVLANHVVALKLLSTHQDTFGRSHKESDDKVRAEVRKYLSKLVRMKSIMDGTSVSSSASTANTDIDSSLSSSSSKAVSDTDGIQSKDTETPVSSHESSHTESSGSSPQTDTEASVPVLESVIRHKLEKFLRENRTASTDKLITWSEENLDKDLHTCVCFVAMQNFEPAVYGIVSENDESNINENVTDETLNENITDETLADAIDSSTESSTIPLKSNANDVFEDDSAIEADLKAEELEKSREENATPFHWGLNIHGYVHFTSPIRRYADIVVHRLLAKQIHAESVLALSSGSAGEHSSEQGGQSQLLPSLVSEEEVAELRAIGARCNTNKRRADDAGIDALLLYFGEYLRRQVPETGIELRAIVKEKKGNNMIEFFLPQLGQVKGGSPATMDCSDEVFKNLQLGHEIRILAKPSPRSLIMEEEGKTDDAASKSADDATSRSADYAKTNTADQDKAPTGSLREEEKKRVTYKSKALWSIKYVGPKL